MSLKEAIPELRRPFTVAAVKFKPQSVTKTGKTICVAYIDARLASERLNLIVPDDWTDTYRPVGNNIMWCDLAVCGVTRSDVGEGTGKALVSDALKRAAVKFGVGVSLYAVPSMILPGEIKMLYPDSRETQQLRDKYEGWLKHHGVKSFGEPLDHGDVPDSAGEPSPPMPTTEPAEAHTSVDERDDAPALQLVPEEVVGSVAADATEAKAAGVDVRAVFKAMGVEPQRAIKQTLRSMTPEQVEAFRSNLADFKAAA